MMGERTPEHNQMNGFRIPRPLGVNGPPAAPGWPSGCTFPEVELPGGQSSQAALTFMRTVLMSFVRGMEHGEQTLPTNDLFVYLPVQILPDLVVAMERQGFTPAEVKGGYGYRPKEEDAEDNPLLVVGVHTKALFMTGTPECRKRSGQKEPTLVVPLTRLWDKLSRFPPFCS